MGVCLVGGFSKIALTKKRAGPAKHGPTLKSLSKIFLAATTQETKRSKETQKSRTWLGNRPNLESKSLCIGEKIGPVEQTADA